MFIQSDNNLQIIILGLAIIISELFYCIISCKRPQSVNIINTASAIANTLYKSKIMRTMLMILILSIY